MHALQSRENAASNACCCYLTAHWPRHAPPLAVNRHNPMDGTDHSLCARLRIDRYPFLVRDP